MATRLAREVLIADCPGGDFTFDRMLITVVKTLTRKFKSRECGPQGRVLYLNPQVQGKTPAAGPGRTATKKTASAGRKTLASAGKTR